MLPTLKRPADYLESGEDKETPSKKHHGAGTSSPSNFLPASTEPHANGGDPEQIAPWANLHPKLVEALSQVPYSPLFGVLWPMIIEQANFETRDLLRDVNSYFKGLCHPYRRSDRAKRAYASHYGNRKDREGLPYVLDLSFDAEWRCWGADKCGFNSIEAFRAFCAVGDIDPDQGRAWDPYAILRYRSHSPHLMHIWMSRTKDVVFETSQNPLVDGFCHLFGLTGVADKAIAMYNFMHDKHEEFDTSEAESAMSTLWEEMTWDREYC